MCGRAFTAPRPPRRRATGRARLRLHATGWTLEDTSTLAAMSDEDCEAATFTSVVLDSDDLRPALLLELDFVSLGRLGGTCWALRRAAAARPAAPARAGRRAQRRRRRRRRGGRGQRGRGLRLNKRTSLRDAAAAALQRPAHGEIPHRRSDAWRAARSSAAVAAEKGTTCAAVRHQTYGNGRDAAGLLAGTTELRCGRFWGLL